MDLEEEGILKRRKREEGNDSLEGLRKRMLAKI
jgi:hypothetical protein